MSDLFWLTDAQMARLAPFFPRSHGKPRVDDRRVLSGIIFINRNGLRWRDAPAAYGPHKTLYSRWKRWSEKGIFARMMGNHPAQAADGWQWSESGVGCFGLAGARGPFLRELVKAFDDPLDPGIFGIEGCT